jgi:hypothetical protein
MRTDGYMKSNRKLLIWTLVTFVIAVLPWVAIALGWI